MNTEFTDQLRQAMTQLPAPVPPDMVKNVCRRHRRRRAARWGITAAGTASIAGLAAVLALSSSTPAARIARPVDGTAYTVSNVVRVLDSLPPGSILFDKQTSLHPGSGQGVDYSWSTQDDSGSLITREQTRDRQYTTAGELETDEELTYTPTTRAGVDVDYQTRTWSQFTAALPAGSASASASASPPSCAAGVPYGWSPDPQLEAAMLRTAISCGILTATDGGIIDGVSTVKLSQRPGSPTTITVWIDATTYLPVRIDQVWADSSSADTQMDMRWLPPTPANQANLTLHIPAGFTQKPWS
jgi:hypothetical protein